MIESSIFFVLSGFLILGSFTVIIPKQTAVSAAGFLLAMISLAGFYALLHLSFLFLAQVMIAVGAVVTVTLLVVSSVNVKEENLPKEKKKYIWMILSFLLLIPFGVLLFKSISSLNLEFSEVSEDFGSLKSIGMDLFTQWALPFELISILLLVALVGAMVTTNKVRKL